MNIVLLWNLYKRLLLDDLIFIFSLAINEVQTSLGCKYVINFSGLS